MGKGNEGTNYGPKEATKRKGFQVFEQGGQNSQRGKEYSLKNGIRPFKWGYLGGGKGNQGGSFREKKEKKMRKGGKKESREGNGVNNNQSFERKVWLG